MRTASFIPVACALALLLLSSAWSARVWDAGTAITGPNRIDVFWGTGTTAEAIAGDLRNPGELYLWLP